MSIKLLIFSTYKEENFPIRVDNRTLLWGLDQANIEWTIHHPWRPLPDLSQFDAVFSSLYSPLYHNFVFYCRKAEAACREAGLPIIQSVENTHPTHTFYLEKWKEHGVPCANYQHFSKFESIKLNYPMILRKDGKHMGQDMYYVSTPEEAKAAIAKQTALVEKHNPAERGPELLDLAIEFVDTKNDMDFYEKWRCYVVNDTIIPAHYLRSRTKFVNYKDAVLDAGTCMTDNEYSIEHTMEIDSETILKAAKATGFGIITLDYSIKPDGSYVFWEGNRLRGTAGDQRIKWLGIRPPDMEYGRVVAQYIVDQVEAHKAQQNSSQQELTNRTNIAIN
mmetsp:Transcript_20934/g.28185  ORF Transcript_20934/g.28185 Transcript_20934/m.28185 type:complete len:334 (+) Transcript_20934:132-1133(+)